MNENEHFIKKTEEEYLTDLSNIKTSIIEELTNENKELKEKLKERDNLIN
jgi:hypothetical protein